MWTGKFFFLDEILTPGTSYLKFQTNKQNQKLIKLKNRIENCPNLKSLDLRANLLAEISDLLPISSLSMLEVLSLADKNNKKANPVCSKYVKNVYVLNFIDNLKMLDQVDINLWPTYEEIDEMKTPKFDILMRRFKPAGIQADNYFNSPGSPEKISLSITKTGGPHPHTDVTISKVAPPPVPSTSVEAAGVLSVQPVVGPPPQADSLTGPAAATAPAAWAPGEQGQQELALSDAVRGGSPSPGIYLPLRLLQRTLAAIGKRRKLNAFVRLITHSLVLRRTPPPVSPPATAEYGGGSFILDGDPQDGNSRCF